MISEQFVPEVLAYLVPEVLTHIVEALTGTALLRIWRSQAKAYRRHKQLN